MQSQIFFVQNYELKYLLQVEMNWNIFMMNWNIFKMNWNIFFKSRLQVRAASPRLLRPGGSFTFGLHSTFDSLYSRQNFLIQLREVHSTHPFFNPKNSITKLWKRRLLDSLFLSCFVQGGREEFYFHDFLAF